MDDYAGRLLADRYRLPRLPSDEFELAETRAFDTASGQEVMVRQVPLPEVVDAEVLDGETLDGLGRGGGQGGGDHPSGRATRRPADPVVRRAVEAARAASTVPDHPRLDQVFDVFVQDDGLWIVSELVPARPLAVLLAERPLSPHRAAEVAADLLAALRVVHAHGWTHRNITTHTVLICDDGRALLTGLAAGAAEEALCGYDPLPSSDRPVFPHGQLPPLDGPPPYVSPPPARNLPETFPRAELPGFARATDLDEDEATVEADGGLPPYVEDENDFQPELGPPFDDERTLPVEGRTRFRPRSERRPRPGEPFGFDASERPPQGPDPDAWPGHPGLPGPRGGHGPYPDRDPESPYLDERAARSGAIAAYRAGAQAGADAAGQAHHRARARDGEPGVDGPGQPPAGPDAAGPPRPPADGGAPEHPDPQGPPEPTAEGGPAPRPLFAKPGQPTGGPLPEPRPAEDRPGPDHGGFPRDEGGPTGLPAVQWAGGDLGPAPGDGPTGSAPSPSSGGSAPGGPGGAETRYRGPTTALAAERARQARITMVGPVTERWAPEQAGPVYENWRLAPPVGPAADLWALGALLFRAVQGHPPYPEEEGTAELVQMVCAEPPAYAEDCGALRPVVESLLRQDPTERPDFEQLRGWLRSLIRSAPEPEVGRHTISVPPSLEPSTPADPRRLPVLRRRGELVRRRRTEKSPVRTRSRHRRSEAPRRLGRLLVGLVFLGLAAAVAVAVLFLPEAEERKPEAGSEPGVPSGGPVPSGDPVRPSSPEAGEPTGTPGSRQPQTTAPPEAVPEGYTFRKDAEGFSLAVPNGWDRHPVNERGQVRYTGEGLELVVIAGRDTVDAFGADPMAYQNQKEEELSPYRSSGWSSASGLRRIDVGSTAMAEGEFAWRDGSGQQVFVQNRAMIVDGRYHVVLVRGSEKAKETVRKHFRQAADSYRTG